VMPKCKLPNASNIFAGRIFMIANRKNILQANMIIGKCGSLFAGECVAEQALIRSPDVLA
jgi:hypothetical protein